MVGSAGNTAASAKAIPKSPLFCLVGAGVVAGAPSSAVAKPKNPRLRGSSLSLLGGSSLSLLVDVGVVDLPDVTDDVGSRLVLDAKQVQALESLLGLHVLGI